MKSGASRAAARGGSPGRATGRRRPSRVQDRTGRMVSLRDALGLAALVALLVLYGVLLGLWEAPCPA